MTTTSRLGSSWRRGRDELQAGGAGEDHVGHQHVEAALAQDGQGRLGVGGHLDLVPGRPQVVRVDGPSEALVVDEEDRVGHRTAGISWPRDLTPLGAQGAPRLGRAACGWPLRLSQLREICEVAAGGGEVVARGEPLPSAFVSTVLGLPAGAGALRPGHRDQPPAGAAGRGAPRHRRPAGRARPSSCRSTPWCRQPSPYAGALVVNGRVALELAVPSLGFAPIEPALDDARAAALARPVDGAGAPLHPRAAHLRRAAVAPGAGGRGRRRWRRCRSRPPRTAACSYHGRAHPPGARRGRPLRPGAVEPVPRAGPASSTPAARRSACWPTGCSGSGRATRARRCSGRPGTRCSGPGDRRLGA